jgi:hypothetical protein
MADTGADKKRENRNAYADRVRLDRILAGPDFRIKNYRQVLRSVFSFSGTPPDKVSKFFVTKRLPAMCDMLEQLVTAVRLMCPRCDHAWNAQLRADSPFAYKVFDVIRHWNISQIAYTAGFLQNRPCPISDLDHLVRLIYRPFFILDTLGADKHLPTILDVLSRQIPPDNDDNDTAREQTVMHVARLWEASRELHYELYPLLLKMLRKTWCDYNDFFTNYHQEIYQFLQIEDDDCD